MAQQAGKPMKRVTLEDGSIVVIPMDAKMAPKWKTTGDEEEDRRRFLESLKQPLPGTY